MRGAGFDLRGQHVLANNTLVHQETVDLFQDIFAGKYADKLPELSSP